MIKNDQEIWWKCEVNGCCNIKKRVKFNVFKGCFPGNRGLSDVDGIVDINGERFLMLEWKTSGSILNTGQRRLFENVTAWDRMTGLVVWGNAETMTTDSFALYRNGKRVDEGRITIDGVKDIMKSWSGVIP